MRRTITRLRLCLAALILMTGQCFGAQLRILTSMPLSFYEPFVEAFSEKYPDVEILVLNKNTNAAIDELLRGNDRLFDIFWSSSPEAFEILRENGSVARSRDTNEPLLHPFAYSAVGWTQKSDAQNNQTSDWDFLLSAEALSQVAFAHPSRSGSAHIVLERFLQVRGWQDGWAYLLEFGANLYTLTARSFTVLEGVSSGRFNIGVTIDFLAHSRSDENLSFTYGSPVMVTTAKIGILEQGKARKNALDFVAFVVSDEGQRLLLSPQIARTPYSPKIRAEAFAPHNKVIDDALALTWLKYDDALASSRYWAVNSLFDVFVFEDFDRRKSAWRKLRELQALGLPSQRRTLEDVSRLLTTMPVVEQEVGREGVTTNANAFSALSRRQQASLERWRAASAEIMEKAEQLLASLEPHGETAE
ncbi:ABC-type Fe3+ transport system substrate-binding protein [Labrenzia sp. EL_142]|nr:ABC-type Fe3+ transport system substrate-binding protein [Labrenzia sp. EL_142]